MDTAIQNPLKSMKLDQYLPNPANLAPPFLKLG